MHIKKGDHIKVMSGKDRGKTGTVLNVSIPDNRVTVEGLNLIKKRTRSKAQGKTGEVVSIPRPMDASNVMLVCKNCKMATRGGFRVERAVKVRYCKKCEAPN
jgi:large subunit ribosomal protein L24